jgi:hypothetical protein
MSARRYWIGVVPEDRVAQAVTEHFVQFQYGRHAPLARMQPGDGLAFYSPRVSDPDGAPRRAFTAIGRVDEGPVFEVPPPPPAPVYRRNASYLEASAAPIAPLLDHLSFIRNKAHWGAAFRFGLLRVPRDDFLTIAAAMGRNGDSDFT